MCCSSEYKKRPLVIHRKRKLLCYIFYSLFEKEEELVMQMKLAFLLFKWKSGDEERENKMNTRCVHRREETWFLPYFRIVQHLFCACVSRVLFSMYSLVIRSSKRKKVGCWLCKSNHFSLELYHICKKSRDRVKTRAREALLFVHYFASFCVVLIFLPCLTLFLRHSLSLSKLDDAINYVGMHKAFGFSERCTR